MTIAKLLHGKQIQAHHATNLLDFDSYIALKSIPSRKLLAEKGNRYTRFFSDANDVALGVWDHTFANLVDAGNFFWTGTRALSTPNAYGPITFKLGYKLWPKAPQFVIRDLAITSKGSIEVDKARMESAIVPFKADPARHSVDGSNGKTFEVDFAAELIPLSGVVSSITVDPIIFKGVNLIEQVEKRLQKNDWSRGITVTPRKVTNTAAPQIMQLLLQWASILQGRLLYTREPLQASVPSDLNQWLSGLSKPKQRALASWLTYIYNGTILHLTL